MFYYALLSLNFNVVLCYVISNEKQELIEMQIKYFQTAKSAGLVVCNPTETLKNCFSKQLVSEIKYINK